MVPNAASLALLIDPTSPNLAKAQSSDLQTAAHGLGLQLHVLQASTDRDFDSAFASVARLRAGGLVISSDSLFFSQSHQLPRTLAAPSHWLKTDLQPVSCGSSETVEGAG
jgi:putative tryptophan/tyrosine transport system substrate-binding protein